MSQFITHEGLVVPLDRVNVDTDAIIPKQFLKSIHRTGFGKNLFDEWRYLDAGEIGKLESERVINPDFVLNKSAYLGASILLCRQNFGCGSSREHAAWAIHDYGIKVLIGVSFADIFYNNAIKNALLPLVLDESVVKVFFEKASEEKNFTLKVDLQNQSVETIEGEIFLFDIAPAKKEALMKGLDEIGVTLECAGDICQFENDRKNKKPWLFDQIR